MRELNEVDLVKIRTALEEETLSKALKAVEKVLKEFVCEERGRIADKIEVDMPTITRYGALQYIRDLWQSLKETEGMKK